MNTRDHIAAAQTSLPEGRTIRREVSHAVFAASGMLALLLAMGIGRFAFTALLPQMREEGLLTIGHGAILAAANYLGYLAGALWTAFSHGANPVRRLIGGLLASVSTTLRMSLDLGLVAWCGVRFVAGIASAAVYVYATGIVLRRLMAVGAPGWSGLHYLGVGCGITVSALFGQAMLDHGSAAGGWFGLGMIAAVAAVCAATGLVPVGRSALSAAESAAVHAESSTPKPLGWLAAAYGLAGFGYIVNMTFLPMMLRGDAGTTNAALTGWLAVGIAALPATALWVRIALRWGTYPALICCTLIQAIGVALPVLMPGIASAMIGAALLGGTFMGIAGLAQWLARVPDPASSARRIGYITAFYGVGQIAGPTLVAMLDRGRDFTLPVLLAAAALLISAVLLEISRRIEKLN